jgi:hypothetical protein
MKRSLPFLCLLLALNANSQKPLSLRDNSIKGPQDFALVIGISKYKYIRPLNYADKDADLFADFLRSPAGGKLKDDNIFKLTNEDATCGNFWSKGFQWLKAKQLQRGDRLFIYLAGHGDAIDADQFFFLGYDCNPGSDKDNYLISGAIQLYNLKKKIAGETSKGVEVFFIMDACRSNELPGGVAGQNFLSTAVSQQRAGELMMLAAAAGQESLEDATIGNGHGLFTYYLVDGMSGLADSVDRADGKVTFKELKTYVDQYVPIVARQRFKREQVPYFCCDENGDRIISTVDPAYLQKWLQTKKNSGKNTVFQRMPVHIKEETADTLLIETYNRFYREIRNRNFSGTNSAESFFIQLNRKFPGNPYTLDARSSLAAAYIDNAEKKLNDYISCNIPVSAADKMEFSNTANNLEKAMGWMKEDDANNANSLLARMLLLRAIGAGNITEAFRYAYACKTINKDAAYINNWLSRLHIQDNRKDSAIYYAELAVKRAPNWPCALTTLSLARSQSQPPEKTDPSRGLVKNKKLMKPAFGITAGGGLEISRPEFRPNGNTTVIDASPASSSSFLGGISIAVPLTNSLYIRPAVTLVRTVTAIDFVVRNSSGGTTTDKIEIKQTGVEISIPLLIHPSAKSSIYFLAGPSLRFNISQDQFSKTVLPVNSTILAGNLGTGLRIPLKKGMILSPELRYLFGFTDLHDANAGTNLSNGLGSLKAREISIGLHLHWTK